MNKKKLGGICAIICMVSVLIYFIWNAFLPAKENSWLIFMAAGIGCAAVSITGGTKKEKDSTEKDADKKEDE